MTNVNDIIIPAGTLDMSAIEEQKVLMQQLVGALIGLQLTGMNPLQGDHAKHIRHLNDIFNLLHKISQ